MIFRTQRNVLNITNARAFRTKSGHVPDVANILNARTFRIFRTLLNARAFRTPDQDAKRAFGIFRKRTPVCAILENPDRSTDSTTLGWAPNRCISCSGHVFCLIMSEVQFLRRIAANRRSPIIYYIYKSLYSNSANFLFYYLLYQCLNRS